MSWGAVIAAGGAIVGGVLSSKGSQSAAQTQQQASDQAIAEQRRQYDQTRADQLALLEQQRNDLAPFRLAGTNALSQMGQLNSGNYSSFNASPDYNFARSEGMRGIQQTAAARGGVASGNALRALSEYNQNLASQQYGNYYNRIANIAGYGQNAVNSGNASGTQAYGNIAQAGGQAGANIGNALIGAGDARASGIVGSANAWGNALGGISQQFGDWANRNRTPYGGGQAQMPVPGSVRNSTLSWGSF